MFAHGDICPEGIKYRERMSKKVARRSMNVKKMKEILYNPEQSQETSEVENSVLCEQCPYVAKSEKILMMHTELVHQCDG